MTNSQIIAQKKKSREDEISAEPQNVVRPTHEGLKGDNLPKGGFIPPGHSLHSDFTDDVEVSQQSEVATVNHQSLPRL